MTVLDDLKAELTAANDRLLATVARLSDPDVAAPSLLPGWTRGHLLTHVARNADSHLNLMTWARTGVYTPQYPDVATRDAEIAEGAGRPMKEQYDDLAESTARLDHAIATLPPERWAAMVRGMQPPEHPAWYIIARRLREVEIHHSDLGTGYTWADWPAAFVRRELHDALACWPREGGPVSEVRADGHVWTGLGEGPVVEGPSAYVLAWVTGRLTGEDAGRADRADAEGLRLAARPPAAPKWPAASAPPGLPAAPPEEYP
ncbi:maleylpyruvate isomerase family mycothiol-dependent enzyme [Sphaerisporangium sp. B11E5]|uniref:maleylpyruvate isomerase family mycothiol-dependent enzyme n=1 Tax=Sphaerisporangium sp. B11E5 TaxID=3153563 RepID=UPI00325DE22E